MAYFYTDANGLLHCNNKIIPSAKYQLEQESGNIIRIGRYDRKGNYYTMLDNIVITELEKEDGSTYTDLAEFLTENPSLINKEKVCTSDPNELLYNPYFDCGLDGWTTNNYSGHVIDNGDGTVTIVTEDPDPAYYSLTPDTQYADAGRYTFTVEVTELNAANGWKFSVKDLSDGWHNLMEETSTGRFSVTYNIDAIKEIQIGHVNASGGESITFTEISMIAN